MWSADAADLVAADWLQSTPVSTYSQFKWRIIDPSRRGRVTANPGSARRTEDWGRLQAHRGEVRQADRAVDDSGDLPVMRAMSNENSQITQTLDLKAVPAAAPATTGGLVWHRILNLHHWPVHKLRGPPASGGKGQLPTKTHERLCKITKRWYYSAARWHRRCAGG